MPRLAVDNFNIVCSVFGGFLIIFGVFSLLITDTFFIADAFISTITGALFSPFVAGLIEPLEYANGSQETLDTITHYLTRIVLGVQLVLAGIQLPPKYVKKNWKPLSIILGIGMTLMWLLTSLIVWGLVPDIHFVYALAIGATMTPTDPVLSASILKGHFADKYIPQDLRMLIVSESGFNDGLGFPFIFLPLNLILFANVTGARLSESGGVGRAIGLWFGDTLGYVILLSVVYGAIAGFITKFLLAWARRHHYMAHELFLAAPIALAVFLVGTVGLIGSDDILACFIAGCVLSWDGWYRDKTEHDTVQPTIDSILNLAVFIWFGAVCPWTSFVGNPAISLGRLVAMSILILLFRRTPVLLALYKFLYPVRNIKDALFVGFFGPIGVSAVFNLGLVLEFFAEIDLEDGERQNFRRMEEQIRVVVWFMVMSSVLAHGTSISISMMVRNITNKDRRHALEHRAGAEIKLVEDRSDQFLRMLLGKRMHKSFKSTSYTRSKTSDKLFGSRSIRFHYGDSAARHRHLDENDEFKSGFE